MPSPMQKAMFVGGLALWFVALATFIVCNIIVVRYAAEHGDAHTRGQVWAYALSDRFDSPNRGLLRFGMFGGLAAILVLGVLGFVTVTRMKSSKGNPPSSTAQP